MDLQRRRYLYNRCVTTEPLAPGDSRNVDLDREAGDLRGQVWVERLATRILLAEEPVCMLFTGLPGSGKSTELKRLEAHLSRPEQGQWVTVLVDAERSLDLGSPLGLVDLLAMVVHEAEREVLRREGRQAEEALKDGYLSRLWTWLSRTDVELKEAQFAVPDGPALVLEMKSRPHLRERLRATVANHLGTFLSEIWTTLESLNERAKRAQDGNSGLVVLVDSLEKLRGTDNFDAVLSSAVQLFGSDAIYLRLPIHVLYTVPPALYTRIQGIDFMPVIRLRTKSGMPHPAGTAALRRIVRQRVPDADLVEILGAEYEARLDRIFQLSGGYPREIVRLLRAMIESPRYPIPEEQFARMLAEVRSAYRNLILTQSYPWLARVATGHQLMLEDDAHRRTMEYVLSQNGLLYYWNGDSWWGLHPAVEQIEGVQKLLQAG